ncbi:Peripheral-type benzodiazepine receptor-associated protein 1 [Aix galericulata]|nr:Peripheral-type benzodiazepine receptor-associated protein 1 [Aix galericulata]
MSRGGVGQGPVARGQPSPRRGPVQHRQELEALRAQLQAERLRSQELQRRFNTEAREMKRRAEQERQLLAQQLRSKWEQERQRERQQLEEQSRRQRAAELRQLLQEKEADRRRKQELLQQQQDAAAQIEALKKKVNLQRRLFYKDVKKAECGAPASHDGDKAVARRDVGVQVSGQQEPCPPSSGDGQLLQAKAKLHNTVQKLGRQCGLLQEEACLLKNEGSLVKAREKAERLSENVTMLGLQTEMLRETVRQLKEHASKSGNAAANTEQVDQQYLDGDAEKKLQLQTKLDMERSRLKNRREELKGHLTKMLNEKASRDQENSQLQGQEERVKEIEDENAALKREVLQVSEQRNAALGIAKHLIKVLKNVGCEFQNMSQLAKRMDQVTELEETKLMLQKKEEEVEHWQKAWAEQQRAHEEELQALRAQLPQSEQQCQQQRQQCELNSNRIVSELPQATTPPTAQAYSEQPRNLSNHDVGSRASEKSTETEGYYYASSTESDVTLNIPGCSSSSDDGSVDGREESGAGHESSIPQSLGQESPSLRRRSARHGCQPVAGPNECPKAEFPLALGKYIYIFGDTKQSVRLLRELQDMRRGVLSSTRAEGADNSQVTTLELRDPVPDSDTEVSSCGIRGRNNQRKNKSF